MNSPPPSRPPGIFILFLGTQNRKNANSGEVSAFSGHGAAVQATGSQLGTILPSAIHYEPFDRDLTDQDGWYPFTRTFAKESLEALQTNPQCKVHRRNTLFRLENVTQFGLFQNTFSVITKLPLDLFYS